ncbi:MAG: DUF1565 domain-containing protein [Sporocytophaga sp.]|nr:DUF1565 domain-containing protein [Sporocytophaga sp.]
MRTFTRISIFLLFLFITSVSWSQVVFVNGAYEKSVSDGTSWDTPYKTIQEAIDAAKPGDSIWIAKGEYNTPEGSDGYTVDKSLLIFGGFDGSEKSFGKRDHKVNVTSLISGDGSVTRYLFKLNQDDLKFELNGLSISESYSVVLIVGKFNSIQIKFANCLIYNIGNFFIGHNDNENANLLTSQLLIENCEINDVGNGYGKFHKIEIHNSEIKNIKSYFFTGFCNGDFIVSNSQLTNITTLTVGFGEQNFILENSTINNERYRSSNPLFLGMVSLKIINSQILDYEGLLIYSDRNRSVSLQNSVFKNINNGSNSVISLNGSVFNDCAIENCTFENCSGYFQGNFNSFKS